MGLAESLFHGLCSTTSTEGELEVMHVFLYPATLLKDLIFTPPSPSPHLRTPHLLVDTIVVSSKAKTVRSSWVHKRTHTQQGEEEWQSALSCRNLITCPLALVCTPFLSRISELRFLEFAPSEPKQVSLLLTQSFPINSKTRVLLSFYFVFWGLLQGAIIQDWWQCQWQT